MKSLRGKSIVITGASSGIGAELARECARRGASLLLAARRAERLEQVAAECNRLAGEALFQACDVTVPAQIAALRDAALVRWGRIDAWVNNAGRGLRQRTLDLTTAQMQEQFELNCLSSLYAYQAVIPQWLAEWQADASVVRHMLDVSSLGGKSGYAYNAAYSAAKHGLSAIGDTLRQELAIDGALYKPGRGGVILTTVYPGPTVSEFGKSAPDLTAGEAATHVLQARGSQSFIRRRVSRAQPTAEVARAMTDALFRPVWTLYPHRWANLAVLLNNFLPGFTLKLVAKGGRGA